MSVEEKSLDFAVKNILVSRIKNRYFTPHEHFVTSVFYGAPTAVTVSHENMFKHIGNVWRSVP